MMCKVRSLTVLLLALVGAAVVDGHGYMTSPRSRNWVAHEDGIEGQAAGVRSREYCHHCLNTNTGVCGKSTNHNYDDNLDSMGQPMPWISQAVLTEGEVIAVESYLDTHHNGHMEVKACPVGDARGLTQACFDDPAHTLTFVEDVSYHVTDTGCMQMPPDPQYPERGYYCGGQGGNYKAFKMLFQLPQGLSGSEILFQYKYITANSCSPPGYDDYFNDNPSLPDSYWSPMVSTCTPPYPQDGSRERGWPEQFWNCAEVTISPSGPSPPTTPAPVAPPVSVPTRTPTMPPPTRAPTMPAPTTPSPVAAPTPFNGNGCCSWSLPRSCDPPDQPQSDWCNANASQCEGGCSGVWVSSAPTASPPTRTPTVSPPVANPTQPPVSPPTPTGPSDFCCSWDRLECQNTDDDWCQASQDRCEGSCSGYWIDPSEPVTCLADWQPCLDDPNGCCDGLQCVGNQWYMQCKPVR